MCTIYEVIHLILIYIHIHEEITTNISFIKLILPQNE